MGEAKEREQRLFRTAALLAAYGRELAQQAIGLVVRPSGEEEFVGGAGIGIAATEFEGPEALDRNVGVIGTLQGADHLASQRIESMDSPVTEVANQQAMAENAEIGARHGNSPGRVEVCAVIETRDHVAVRIEDGDIAEAVAVVLIVRAGRAVRKRDHDVSTHILDTERGIVLWQRAVDESAGSQCHRMEAAVTRTSGTC